jgi:hypothetical protein
MVKAKVSVNGIIEVEGEDRLTGIIQELVLGIYTEEGEVEDLPEDVKVIDYEDTIATEVSS